MKAKKVLAYHFTDGMKLRDGQELVVGKTYKYDGKLEMCKTGYHASVDIRHALSYAPGLTLSRVECSGGMIEGDDKLVCRQRKALWSFDAKDVIIKWSMRVATDAIKTAKKVCKDKAWNTWADSWISGEYRSARAAANAAYAANAAARAAANAAFASDAADAADEAAYAANAAARAAANAAFASDAADAADEAVYAARAAAYAADAAFASDAAAHAADEAVYAARAAAYAADAAAEKKYSGWLVAMIEKERVK